MLERACRHDLHIAPTTASTGFLRMELPGTSRPIAAGTAIVAALPTATAITIRRRSKARRQVCIWKSVASRPSGECCKCGRKRSILGLKSRSSPDHLKAGSGAAGGGAAGRSSGDGHLPKLWGQSLNQVGNRTILWRFGAETRLLRYVGLRLSPMSRHPRCADLSALP